jgi:hypothetical protein
MATKRPCLKAGQAPPPFDRYGQANDDASGAYIGGHGAMVDNPDQASFGEPKSPMPDISSHALRRLDRANAGTMNCSN